MLAGIVSRAAKAAGKYFHSVLLKSKPCLTFSCPYAALTYGCSSISTASPASPALWQKEAILPQGACRGTSAHIMVLETAGLAQSSLGSRAAGGWLAPAKATQLWARTGDSFLETWGRGGYASMNAPYKYSSQHENPAKKEKFSTIPRNFCRLLFLIPEQNICCNIPCDDVCSCLTTWHQSQMWISDYYMVSSKSFSTFYPHTI